MFHFVIGARFYRPQKHNLRHKKCLPACSEENKFVFDPEAFPPPLPGPLNKGATKASRGGGGGGYLIQSYKRVKKVLIHFLQL